MRGRLTAHRYLIALGSNMPHVRHGAPRKVVGAALKRLDIAGEPAAPVVTSLPLGPSRRAYANTAALIASDLAPPQLLARLQAIEREFGRRRTGQRWAARVLDLDIILWSGGRWAGPDLTIPHTQFRRRAFVLAPALSLAANWRDPITGLTLRHLHHRLTRRRPAPR